MALSQRFCPKYTIQNGDAIGTKVRGHYIYREDGRSTGVAIKRGSTACILYICDISRCSPQNILHVLYIDNIICHPLVTYTVQRLY